MLYRIIIKNIDTDASLMTAIDEAFGKDISDEKAKEIRNNLPYTVWTGDDLTLAKQYNKTINNWRTKAEIVDENDNIVKIPKVDSSSGVGKLLKILSIIVFVISIIGCLKIFSVQPITGLVMVIVSLLFSSLIFGIGEVICVLKSIDSKL